MAKTKNNGRSRTKHQTRRQKQQQTWNMKLAPINPNGPPLMPINLQITDNVEVEEGTPQPLPDVNVTTCFTPAAPHLITMPFPGIGMSREKFTDAKGEEQTKLCLSVSYIMDTRNNEYVHPKECERKIDASPVYWEPLQDIMFDDTVESSSEKKKD